jgi:hypothetical protein
MDVGVGGDYLEGNERVPEEVQPIDVVLQLG